jgi:3-oxoacyl-[acyl-carrier protein] reductase|tara:strand:- start:1213 stop:1932 length:720 start_codon:yes stop_codon:yes gene_type:complete
VANKVKLTNKVIVISGAGRGVGRSIALALASEKTRLVLVARTVSELEDVKVEVEDLGASAIVCPTDISDPHQIQVMADETLKAFETVDVIINNAGWSPPLRPIQDTTIEDWNYVVNVNARGTFLITKVFLPTLLAKQSGHVINISSVTGVRGVATASAYCMSKAAQLAFGQSLLAEVRSHGIHVTNLTSEPVDTRMRWEITPDYPADRVMQPDDIGQIVVNLLKMGEKVVIDEIPIRVL